MNTNYILLALFLDYLPFKNNAIKNAYEKYELSKENYRLDLNLVVDGICTEKELFNIYHQFWGIEIYVDNHYSCDFDLIKSLGQSFINENGIIPLSKIRGELIFASTDLFAHNKHSKINMLDFTSKRLILMTAEQLKRIMIMIFSGEKTSDLIDLLADANEEDVIIANDDLSLSQAPIVQLVDSVLKEAVMLGSSDIHFEPRETIVQIRMRLDGLLVKRANFNIKLYASILTRIKIQAGLDITKKRIPQDGRLKFINEDAEYDCRVSTLPLVHGEKLVIRILDHQKLSWSLNELGFKGEDFNLIKEILRTPHGMILLTGPTGCGKTTTLYSFLMELNNDQRNIVTVEDPIEYIIPGINQLQVNPNINVTFASALRSILRQDPDIIMIGEIRDEETAQIATRAAITGHLVMATIHTNQSLTAITRLMDMGVENYLISESLVAIISQRLVRTLCSFCKEKAPIKPTEEAYFTNESIPYLYHEKGCIHCHFTGYWGRCAIYEIIRLDDEIKMMVHQKMSLEEIKEQAVHQGMQCLVEKGIKLVKEGITSLNELIRLGII